jgi:hypothetical protein
MNSLPCGFIQFTSSPLSGLPLAKRFQDSSRYSLSFELFPLLTFVLPSVSNGVAKLRSFFYSPKVFLTFFILFLRSPIPESPAIADFP